MSEPRPRGAVVTVIGPPESGKSTLLWDLYAKHAPRLLTIEVVEETLQRDPTAVRTFGLQEALGALADCAEWNGERWHVVASISRDEIPSLFNVLAPLPRTKNTVSFARAVGGMAVHCGELAFMAPNGLGKNSPIKDAYLRYRHHWLSIFGATQHAPDCDPCTRMSAERCVFLRTSDDLGLQAVARASSTALAARVKLLPSHHSLTVSKSWDRAYVADEKFRVYAVLDYDGNPLSGAVVESPGSTGVALSAVAGVVGARGAGHRQRRA